MISHGILAGMDGYILLGLVFDEPILPPCTEPKECWMDRKAYSLFQKRRLDNHAT